ncbi:diaminopimelate decarboxylase [Enhygromyxa salina]|nr:diaminopimelate decarboxylase [Enhygromyxa salina]
MSALPAHLLSDNATIAPDGRLQIAGLDAVALAERFGTPLFVYDEDHIRARCRAARAAFPDGVAYASKAFLCRAIAKLAYEEGMQIDVASGGEMHVALAAGVPAKTLVFHGNNKSEAELRYAMREGVHRIVVDSFDELDRIEALVAEGLPAPAILLRITPGVVAHTHEFVQTGQHDSKFGFGVGAGVAKAAIERATASSAMRLLGLHAHVGSQVFDVSSFEKVIEVLAPIFNPLGLEELCIGGGLGVAYVEGESTSDILEWGAAIRRACADQGITGRITAEPGRSIVAASALTLYRVGTIKPIPGVRTYVAVDGGMSDNPRPVLYGSGYETFLPRAASADRPSTIRLVGKHCESGDLLVRDGLVPSDLAVGDIIATPVTGAYGYSLGSNYNKVPRPSVVFVKAGEAREVIRRETWDDLLRLDL